MRRRIETFESFSDCSTKPHHYLDEYGGELTLRDPPLALYDDALWAELREAQQRLRDVETRILATAIREPLDEVEIDLGRKLWRMIGPDGEFDADECSRIEDVLRKHASTVERKS